MGIIFFLVITPIGLILRIFRKDVLKLKFSSDKSYWIDKDSLKSTMKINFNMSFIKEFCQLNEEKNIYYQLL